MEYIILMNMISWYIAIAMFMGYSFIKNCERFLAFPFHEKSLENDMASMGAEKTIEEYNSRSWSGRVVYMLVLGTKFMALPFKLKGRD